MKFIHMADVHLNMMPEEGNGMGFIRKREIQGTFDRVLMEAVNQKIDLLLIAGDLFHHPPSMDELRELNARFKKISGIRVVMIAGNHDWIEKDSPYDRFCFADNVYFLKSDQLESVYFEDLNITVWGFSYHQKQIREPRYNGLKPYGEGYHILLAHGGDEQHIPIDYEQLKWAGFDYTALGHIHKPEVLAEDFMNYSGSLEPLDHTETGQHGYFMGEITGDGQQVHFIPIACRTYETIELNVEPDDTEYEISQKAEQIIKSRGRDNFYTISLSGQKKASKEWTFDTLKRDYHLVKFLDHTGMDYSISELYEQNHNNILGRFIEEIWKQGDNPIWDAVLKKGVEALLETKVKREEV